MAEDGEGSTRARTLNRSAAPVSYVNRSTEPRFVSSLVATIQRNGTGGRPCATRVKRRGDEDQFLSSATAVWLLVLISWVLTVDGPMTVAPLPRRRGSGSRGRPARLETSRRFPAGSMPLIL